MKKEVTKEIIVCDFCKKDNVFIGGVKCFICEKDLCKYHSTSVDFGTELYVRHKPLHLCPEHAKPLHEVVKIMENKKKVIITEA